MSCIQAQLLFTTGGGLTSNEWMVGEGGGGGGGVGGGAGGEGGAGGGLTKG